MHLLPVIVARNYTLKPVGLVPPPPGVIPNFNNPESVYGRVMTAELITLGIALPFVLMRIYTRLFITRAVGWDDCKTAPCFDNHNRC